MEYGAALCVFLFMAREKIKKNKKNLKMMSNPLSFCFVKRQNFERLKCKKANPLQSQSMLNSEFFYVEK